MTTTQNLGLNCWTADDPIQVSQLSENFEKLDQSQPVVKLIDVEDTTGGANQIDIDLTGIDLSAWRYLEFDVRLAGNADSYSCKMRLNSISSKDYYSTTLSSTTTGTAKDHLCTVYSGKGAVPDSTYPRKARGTLRLYACDDTIFTVAESHSANNESFWSQSVFGTIKRTALTPAALQSVNFLPESGTASLAAGTKITVYGVRK